MSRTRRVPLLLLLLGLLLGALLGGCATTPQPAAEAAPAATPVGAAMFELQIDAPPALRPLLQTHLDLAQLSRLRSTDKISETELARLIAATPAQTRQLLETEGYFDPVVQVQREADAAGLPRVTVNVQPGPRVQVVQVQLDAIGELGTRAAEGDAHARALLDALRSAWPLKTGQPFRNPAWSEAKTTVLTMLRAEGYAAASWARTDAQVDVEHDQAHLALVADSGPRFIAGELQIEGLEHQSETDVRHLAGFTPGTPLTEQMLIDFQERLQGSGLFDRATVVLDPDPAHAKAATVHVQLHEQSLQQATVGVGFSAIAGPRASIEHWHRRAFGLPLTTRTKFEWGRDRQAVDGDVSRHATEDFWRDFLGYSAERLRTSSDTVTSLAGRAGRAQDQPNIQRRYYLEARSAIRTTATTREQGSALWGNYEWGWRELDSNVLPTNGFTLSLQSGGGRAHDHTGAAGGFGRFYGRAVGYWPLGDRWYTDARLELGQVVTTNDVDVPDPLLFRAGGDDSVRGYAYRSLAPTAPDGSVVGGKALFTASVELAHPISANLPALWWAVFADAGRAATSFSHLHPAYGAGAGIRWRSPVGPLKIDFAYGNETRRVRLHVSVGIAF
jgi:translocation and assembly module TamA